MVNNFSCSYTVKPRFTLLPNTGFMCKLVYFTIQFTGPPDISGLNPLPERPGKSGSYCTILLISITSEKLNCGMNTGMYTAIICLGYGIAAVLIHTFDFHSSFTLESGYFKR